MNLPEGCSITLLSKEECKEMFAPTVDGKSSDIAGGPASWLLAHCHDGVTWGRFDRESCSWHWSSTAFPDLCPQVSADNLLEIRLFGMDGETMLWRTEAGFQGRRLVDRDMQDASSPAWPAEELRILLGNRLCEPARNGFSRVGTASGAQQAVPLVCDENDFKNDRWPLRLKVRHYFEHDQETGLVRVAASRLVNVFKAKEAC